ncbi:histidine kinase [Pseudoduganella sp. LjRoot289]
MALPFAAGELGPAPALRRLAGCNARQASASAALVLALCGLAWQRHAYSWLILFAALLVAAALGLALLQLVRLVLSVQPASPDGGWGWAWGGLLAALAAGAGGAALAYRGLAALLSLHSLGGGQVFGSALAFGALLLALPLMVSRRQSQALHLAALRQAALSAELKSLQAQVEPHFLYNTLANTRYLARHEPAKAVEMLDHLIAYLHTALPDMRTTASTLGRECELAEHYLALMAIRFGERMSYQVECPAGLAQAAMPPLMLMSLVENAVRHGVEAKPGPVLVRVGAEQVDGSLRVLVADSGAGLAEAVFGSGVGLRNVRERLAAQYGGAGGFELRTGVAGHTEAELRLPLAWTETVPARRAKAAAAGGVA